MGMKWRTTITGQGCPVPLGYQTENPAVCVFKVETKGGAGRRHPSPPVWGSLWVGEREHG